MNAFAKMLSIEIRRGFLSRRFAAVMAIEVLFVVCHIAIFVIPQASEQRMYVLQGGYPLSVFNRWIGGWPGSMFPAAFFFLLPFLVCVPYSDTLYVDQKSGWSAQAITRSSRTSYYAAKAFTAFAVGVVVACIPLLLDFYLTCLFLPVVQPSVASRMFPIFNESMWHDLYYRDALAYNARYLILIAVTAGLIACLPLALSGVISNRVVLLCAPFFYAWCWISCSERTILPDSRQYRSCDPINLFGFNHLAISA